MEGIQETKELLEGLNELGIVLVKTFKDGAQVSDIGALLAAIVANDEVKDALLKAVGGITKVPAEIKDITLAEGMELVVDEITMIPKLIAAFKS